MEEEDQLEVEKKNELENLKLLGIERARRDEEMRLKRFAILLQFFRCLTLDGTQGT
jgi:hypothetical protein